VDQWGNIASIGLAGGTELKTTVMPFILRGVNLLGITRADATGDAPCRLGAHRRRPASGPARPHLPEGGPFATLPAQFDDYLQGRVTGRTVVKIA